MKDLILVIDVESIGLHGPGYAVGYVLIDFRGVVMYEGTHATDPHNKGFDRDEQALQWHDDHVNIENYNCKSFYDVRRQFWDTWDKVRHQAWMAADCTWPVEANFLTACIADDPVDRLWKGPYPLLDIATVRIAGGFRDYKQEARLPNELPEHNPLMDARQSARLIAETLPEFNGALDILERGL